jgi:hypothetical protein
MTVDQITNINLDISDEPEEIKVSHTITFPNGEVPVKIRVRSEPHQWGILKMNQDPIALIQAFCHPEDWRALDAWMSGRKQMGDGLLNKIITAMVETPTGHPTPDSDGSLES